MLHDSSRLHEPGRWRRRHTVIGMAATGIFLGYIDRVNFSVAAVAMQHDLGWSETIKGWALAAFFIGYLLFQVPAGWLANRYGARVTFGLAAVCWSVVTVVTPWAAMASLPLLILARIALGVSEAVNYPAVYGLLARWAPPGERSRAAAVIGVAAPLGTLVGLSMTAWFIVVWNWHLSFFVFGTVALIWTFAWFRLVSDDPDVDHRIADDERSMLAALRTRKASRESVPWRAIFRSRAAWALMINYFAVNWAFYVLLAWAPSYYRNYLGLNVLDSGLYSAAPFVIMMVVCLFVGAWVDRLLRKGWQLVLLRKAFQISGLVGAAVFVVLAGVTRQPSMAVLSVCGALGCIALCYGGAVPNHLDIAPRYADVLMSIINTIGTLPGVIGVVLTGWLVDSTGSYFTAFCLAAVIQIVAALFWFAWASASPIAGTEYVANEAAPC